MVPGERGVGQNCTETRQNAHGDKKTTVRQQSCCVTAERVSGGAKYIQTARAAITVAVTVERAGVQRIVTTVAQQLAEGTLSRS